MGYRDDFYTFENIVGYTGDLHLSPAVYFQSNSEYGRITQAHKKLDNIGRGKVRNISGYSIRNLYVERYGRRELRAVESVNGEVRHTSRNVYITDFSDDDRSILATSIRDYRETKGNLSGEQQAELDYWNMNRWTERDQEAARIIFALQNHAGQ